MMYCTACYTGGEIFPFGFCKKCWIREGKPAGMDGKKRIIRYDYNDNK